MLSHCHSNGQMVCDGHSSFLLLSYRLVVLKLLLCVWRLNVKLSFVNDNERPTVKVVRRHPWHWQTLIVSGKQFGFDFVYQNTIWSLITGLSEDQRCIARVFVLIFLWELLEHYKTTISWAEHDILLLANKSLVACLSVTCVQGIIFIAI